MLAGPVRGALEDGLNSDKVYFFQGTQYWRYDLKKDYGEVDFPRPLRDWKLPQEFDSGVDACLSGQGKYQGKSFFFKDQWYVTYDWKTRAVSKPQLIARWDGAHAFPFPRGIDAAINGQEPHEGKAYFFKDDKYARYDWNDDRFDLMDQKLSAWRLGDGFDSHITACLRGKKGGGWPKQHPTAYFFQGDRYVQYDWKEDRGLAGYPLLISAGWPTGCAVWAVHSKFPTNPCSDIRLKKGEVKAAYPYGSLEGQAGWQIQTKFKTISELADRLSKLIIPDFYGDDNAGKGFVPRGRITRLGICAHGWAGRFEANGEDDPNKPVWNTSAFLTDTNVLVTGKGGVRDDLERILPMLAFGAPVLLLGCQAAQGTTGSNLVMAVSKVLRDHPVTAFTSIGFAGLKNSHRGDEGCEEAGMRDTQAMNDTDIKIKNWSDLEKWPWAWEFSPSAKTALNNEINEYPANDYF
jgi:hypothetical protein